MSDRITFSVPYCFLKVNMNDVQTRDSLGLFDFLPVFMHLTSASVPVQHLTARGHLQGHPSIRGKKNPKKRKETYGNWGRKKECCHGVPPFCLFCLLQSFILAQKVTVGHYAAYSCSPVLLCHHYCVPAAYCDEAK